MHIYIYIYINMHRCNSKSKSYISYIISVLHFLTPPVINLEQINLGRPNPNPDPWCMYLIRCTVKSYSAFFSNRSSWLNKVEESGGGPTWLLGNSVTTCQSVRRSEWGLVTQSGLCIVLSPPLFSSYQNAKFFAYRTSSMRLFDVQVENINNSYSTALKIGG